MLEKVRAALRITVRAYDEELERLISAAQLDLGVAGVVIPEEMDALVETAVVTYCRLYFGSPADYDRLKRSYDEQKAQLSMHTGHTSWEVGD